MPTTQNLKLPCSIFNSKEKCLQYTGKVFLKANEQKPHAYCDSSCVRGQRNTSERFPQNKQWLSPVVGLWVGFAFFVNPFYTFECFK